MSSDPSASSSPPRVGSPIPQCTGSAELLRCPSCRLPLWEPVTVSCGHSFCKPCLGGAVPSRCSVCHRRLKLLGVEAVRCNVVLCNLLEKCEERESRSARLAACIRSCLARGDLQDALRMAQKGIEMGKQCGARGAANVMGLGGAIGAGGYQCRSFCPCTPLGAEHLGSSLGVLKVLERNGEGRNTCWALLLGHPHPCRRPSATEGHGLPRTIVAAYR